MFEGLRPLDQKEVPDERKKQSIMEPTFSASPTIA
jgi:hypothetical protein